MNIVTARKIANQQVEWWIMQGVSPKQAWRALGGDPIPTPCWADCAGFMIDWTLRRCGHGDAPVLTIWARDIPEL